MRTNLPPHHSIGSPDLHHLLAPHSNRALIKAPYAPYLRVPHVDSVNGLDQPQIASEIRWLMSRCRLSPRLHSSFLAG